MPSSLHRGPFLHDCLIAGRAFWRMLDVFLARHELFALANALLTVLFGLLLLRVAGLLWPLRSNPSLQLGLRRLVYLIALFKGAFDLIFGDNLRLYGQPIGLGWQLPAPHWLNPLYWRVHFSPFDTTSATYLVTLFLGGAAVYLFLLRAYRVGMASRVLITLDQICPARDPRIDAALQRAAQVLKIPAAVKLPKVLLVEVECATPLLIGVLQPRLLISPGLVALLTDDELEMALRHELAHLKRKDHLWRWIQLCIEDISRPIFIGGRLGAYSVEMEEFLCDRAAVSSPKDAASLANAIAKASSLLPNPVPPQSPNDSGGGRAVPGLNESVLPSLLGKHQSVLSETASLNRRIQQLLALSLQLSEKGSSSSSPLPKRRFLDPLRAAAEFPFLLILALFLFCALYGRFHLLLSIAH
jgi:Zn-dependent protease with chaperone function